MFQNRFKDLINILGFTQDCGDFTQNHCSLFGDKYYGYCNAIACYCNRENGRCDLDVHMLWKIRVFTIILLGITTIYIRRRYNF